MTDTTGRLDTLKQPEFLARVAQTSGAELIR